MNNLQILFLHLHFDQEHDVAHKRKVYYYFDVDCDDYFVDYFYFHFQYEGIFSSTTANSASFCLNLVCCDLTNYFGILNWLCSDLDLIKHPSFCFHPGFHRKSANSLGLQETS